MPIFGSHVSCAGGFDRAIARAIEGGCDCLQIFVSNPPRQWPVVAATTEGTAERGKKTNHARASANKGAKKSAGDWVAKDVPVEKIDRWRDAFSRSELVAPIAHASYLINLATPDEALRKKSCEALIAELELCNRLGLEGLVLHPGAFTTSSEEAGIDRVCDSIQQAFERVGSGSCRLLLENTAGQGTCLGHTLDQLSSIWSGADRPERLGICLDTCHAFAAGYEINRPAGLCEFTQQLSDLLPPGCIRALHLNDSKKPLGSRVDRHEHIGRGEIGLAGFRTFLSHSMFQEIPGYLETEKGVDEQTGEEWDRINLDVLRQL